MIYSAVVALVCVTLVALLRLWAIGAIAVICWMQNFLLPWWYTKGWIDVEMAVALLLVKEFLLLMIVAYLGWRVTGVRLGTLPAPMKAAALYGAYLLVRLPIGVVVFGEPLLDELRLVRSVVFPVEAVFIGFVVGFLVPAFRVHYEKLMVRGIVGLAIVSLVLYFGADEGFWANHVNIALYNINVKGDPEWTVLLDRGISATGAGRAAFAWLADLRLIGTFGDPLTAGFALTVPLILLSSRRRLGPGAAAALAVVVVAVFLTFSRSAWVMAATGFVYAALSQRRAFRVILFLGVGAVAWFALGGLRQFFFESLAAFESSQGDIYHAEGIRFLYSRAVLDVRYLVGVGPLDAFQDRALLENGLAYILTQFGVVLLAAFAALCFSTERYLRKQGGQTDPFVIGAAAMGIGTLVVSHFSFYALSFTSYFAIWTVIGVAIGLVHRRRIEAGRIEAEGIGDGERSALSNPADGKLRMDLESGG